MEKTMGPVPESSASSASEARPRKDDARHETTAAQEEDIFIKKVHARPLNDTYLLLRKIGEGGCGAVYLGMGDTHLGPSHVVVMLTSRDTGRDISTEEDVALKLEHHSRDPSMLFNEADVYKEFQGHHGFPKVYWYGEHDDYKVLAFELLGPSFADLLAFCGGRFSLKTALMTMDQLLHRIETIHSRRFLHRDIKPGNCLLGSGKTSNVVYITDFGLAEEAAPAHHTYDETKASSLPPHLVGTATYASIRAHKGQAQSFRDDLESLGYMLILFLRGKLPWQGLKGRKEDLPALVLEKKQSISVEDLCAGLPDEVAEYMRDVRRLGYGEQPKYAEMRERFRARAREDDLDYDDVFDWVVLLYIQQKDEL